MNKMGISHPRRPVPRRLPALISVATRQQGGHRLDGRKTVVLACPLAQKLIVSARLQSAGEERLALFMLDAKSAGLQIDAYRLVDGRACGDLLLEGVSCPASSLLAEGDVALHWMRRSTMPVWPRCRRPSATSNPACASRPST